MNRADLAGRIDVVEHRMDSMEHRLDASFAALSSQIVQSHRETRDEIAATLRGEMRAFGEALRGEMRAMGESLRGEIGTTAEGLRGEMRAMGDALRGEMGSLGEDLRGEMREMGGALHQEMHTLNGGTNHRIDKLEAAMVQGFAEERRFTLILHEEVLSRITLIGEGRPG
jgi:hypothetical protein